ncbi:unnamed protein product [Brassicogethes aeneus]|uniref:Uncharacterized protein n=1 Tax=Brassicogethes aeneus TaxID=1431903 RepID=A0A9P0B490_BRAAE|nr:unnamed protein product [Brassicogethes aeneus]
MSKNNHKCYGYPLPAKSIHSSTEALNSIENDPNFLEMKIPTSPKAKKEVMSKSSMYLKFKLLTIMTTLSNGFFIRAETALSIKTFFAECNIPVLDHPPNLPDKAPCDFYLFPKLK